MQGWIYFVGAVVGDKARVKIGFTKGDPNERLRTLQCGSPVPLAVITAVPGSQKVERILHETFAPLRTGGEWFDVKLKLFDFLIALEEAAERRTAPDMLEVLAAIEVSILNDTPHRETDDPDEYERSANTTHFEWMRALRNMPDEVVAKYLEEAE